MRLIGMGLLAFLLAGVALMLARSDALNQTLHLLRDLRNGPQLQFEVPVAAPATGTAQAVVLRRSPDVPIILSGLPAYQGAAFTMPVNAGPTSGYLQIDATYQVLDGVEGVLRISIDNTRRAEMLLHPGEAGRSVRIQLTADEIARPQLVVSFSLLGQGLQPACGSDDGVEAVVEIETTSALHLELDRPISTPRDRMAVWGGHLRMTWLDVDQADTLILARDARARGMGVGFSNADDALDLTEAAALLADRPQTNDPLPVHAWDSALSDRSSLFAMRRFHHATDWRIRYDLRDARNPMLPARLALDMALGTQPGAAQWHVIVTLNGSLVAQDLVPRGQTRVTLDVALPADLARAANTIEITALSTHSPEGICNTGPELVAEILRSTRIVAGDMVHDPDLARLRDALAQIGAASVAVHGSLSLPEADAATGLLLALMPDLPLATARDAAIITVLPRDTDPRLVPGATEPGAWIVHHDHDSAGLVAAPATTPVHPGSVMLLIRPVGPAT